VLFRSTAIGDEGGSKAVAGEKFGHAAIAFPGLWQEAASLQRQHAGQGTFVGRQVERQSELRGVRGEGEIRDDAELFVGVCRQRRQQHGQQQRYGSDRAVWVDGRSVGHCVMCSENWWQSSLVGRRALQKGRTGAWDFAMGDVSRCRTCSRLRN
jgi:hypothetical protein